MSPQNAASWPSGTTNLINVNYANSQDTKYLYTGRRSVDPHDIETFG